MYGFLSSCDTTILHLNYNRLYVKDLDEKWNKQVSNCPQLKGAMKPGMTAKKLLVANFEELVDVYFHYIQYLKGLDAAEQALVKDKAEKVFTYDSFREKIRDFLLDSVNGFGIHNCVYCDTEKVDSFKKNDKSVRRFETEHVLDKGSCPLVGLSLHNFVPSCGICNSAALKGVNLIGDTQDEIKLLSPTNPRYNFWYKVLFVVIPNGNNFTDNKKADYPDHYEIDFMYKDSAYSKFVDLFALKNRYNNDYLKEALLLLDQKARMTPKMIADIAQLYKCTPEEVYEDQFKVKLYQTEHKTYRKIREDLLGLTKLL
jgi:hypothetical protein